ncbi:MAG: hypothetical protein R3284_02260 [Rubricoccaceae bacterium]|nr:hypothetical protein [Rubricoccaceae bacterium]
MDDRADQKTGAAPKPNVSRASIALEGRAIRYAEVVQPEEGPAALRRLGTADFDFDVAESILSESGPAHLDTVLDAVGQILRGTTARSLQVVVHPNRLVGFFSPLPESLSASERYEQLRQEAALLADVKTTEPVRIRASPLRSEDVLVEERPISHRWHHVFHVPEPVHARLTLVARALNMGTYDLTDSTRAAAAVVREVDRSAPLPAMPDPEKQITLALGVYPGMVELSVLRSGLWYHSHYATIGAPDDAAYFAVALLEKLNIPNSEVGRLVMYGKQADPDEFHLLSTLFDVTPTLLNPLKIFGRTPEGVSPALLAGYAPCIGPVV